jgi:hypothetical protein
MNNTQRIGLVFTVLASLAACIPQAVWAAPSPPPAVVDVTLRSGGVLVGKVINNSGVAQSRAVVSIRMDGRELVTAMTDADGYFAIKGLRGGLYQVVTSGGQGMFQLWMAGTAPPGAKEGALVITSQIVRGQAPESNNTSNHGGIFNNPLVIAGIVATAVAVPVALTQNSRSG